MRGAPLLRLSKSLETIFALYIKNAARIEKAKLPTFPAPQDDVVGFDELCLRKTPLNKNGVDKEVIFNKTMPKKLTYLEFEKLAVTKSAQDERISVAVDKHEKTQQQRSLLQNAVRILVLAASGLLVFFLGRKLLALRK